MKRHFAAFIGLIVACAALNSSLLAAAKPNVLFIICDDLNCDLGCYGHPLVKTPNLDRLADRGVLFQNAHCNYPLCGPSRASFMSGLYPDQSLIQRNAIYLREHVPNVKTISQSFRAAGYFATRIGKLYHYNVPKHIGTSGHDDPYSWNRTINPYGRDKWDEDEIFSLKPGNFGATLSWLAADGTDQEQTDGMSATHAIDVMKQHAKDDSPFFLALGLFRPHTPYVAPKAYFDMYDLADIKVPVVPDGYYQSVPSEARRWLSRRKEQVDLDPEIAKKAIRAYYASISFADAQIGRVLDALKSSGLDQNTIVLFTSDHGYHMGEHNHYQKTTLCENATHVPLVIAGPGISPGHSKNTFAEMVDFYPTLTELAGLKRPPHVSGVSLVPALKNPEVVVRDSALTQLGSGYSLRTKDYRFNVWGEAGASGRELYDRRSDQAEMLNKIDAPEYAEVVAGLQQQIDARIQQARSKPKGIKQIEFKNNRHVPSK